MPLFYLGYCPQEEFECAGRLVRLREGRPGPQSLFEAAQTALTPHEDLMEIRYRARDLRVATVHLLSRHRDRYAPVLLAHAEARLGRLLQDNEGPAEAALAHLQDFTAYVGLESLQGLAALLLRVLRPDAPPTRVLPPQLSPQSADPRAGAC